MHMAKYDIVLLRPYTDGSNKHFWQMYKQGVEGITKARAIGCKAIKGLAGHEAYICKAGIQPTSRSLNGQAYEVIMNAYSHRGTQYDGCVIDRDYAKDPYHRLMRVDTTGRIWVDKTLFRE